jgi:hypothetical protein
MLEKFFYKINKELNVEFRQSGNYIVDSTGKKILYSKNKCAEILTTN